MDVAAAHPMPLQSLEMTESTLKVRANAAPGLFYHDCPMELVHLAQQQLRAEPLRPLNERVTLSEHFASIPRTFIACSEDQTFPLVFQERMAASAHCDPVLSLPSSHSPFFSMPSTLVHLLLLLSAKTGYPAEGRQ
jgi:hypothetical protein